MGLMENMKNRVRSWLEIEPATGIQVRINESVDFYMNAIVNRIWYRGEADELEQLYQQINVYPLNAQRFWSAIPTPGLEIRKIHTGLPANIVKMLTSIVVADINDIDINNKAYHDEWLEIAKDNNWKKLIEEAIKKTLYIGDGAFKVSYDSELSKYPIIEFYSGEDIEFRMKRGRVEAVVFNTKTRAGNTTYTLKEIYGMGYIDYELYRRDEQIDLQSLESTRDLRRIEFGSEDDKYMLAVPLKFFSSDKWNGRGASVYDHKRDAFDSIDEAWSQWMDALRSGRTREYIPESMVPRDPHTGALMQPNSFDNRFIKVSENVAEGASNTITTEQPSIPHDSYLATYITALDLCLQGLISPSTLGIDVKKMDNAEAQREKEKATLYTRNIIVETLQESLKELVEVVLKAYYALSNEALKPAEITVSFGEYANPSFESQIETVGKGKQQGIMSIEACVDELYGDTKDTEWKNEEVKRLKEEQGITEMEEPSVNLDGLEVIS